MRFQWLPNLNPNALEADEDEAEAVDDAAEVAVEVFPPPRAPLRIVFQKVLFNKILRLIYLPHPPYLRERCLLHLGSHLHQNKIYIKNHHNQKENKKKWIRM